MLALSFPVPGRKRLLVKGLSEQPWAGTGWKACGWGKAWGAATEDLRMTYSRGITIFGRSLPCLPNHQPHTRETSTCGSSFACIEWWFALGRGPENKKQLFGRTTFPLGPYISKAIRDRDIMINHWAVSVVLPRPPVLSALLPPCHLEPLPDSHLFACPTEHPDEFSWP